MANTTWTIEVEGVEKSVTDWGVLLNFEAFRQNKARSTMSFQTSESFDPTRTQWTYMQRAIVRRDRTSTGGVFDNGSGTIFFKGYFDDPRMERSGEAQNIVYDLHNAWWLLEINPFKQYRNEFVGFSATNKRVLSATIAAAGNGYKKLDKLIITGGAGTGALYQVVAVNSTGGVVLVWPLNGGGNYTVTPPSPNTVDNSQASGGGCSLSLTFQAAPVTVQQVLSEVFLGEDFHAANGYTSLWPNGNGDQIAEIIAWLNGLDWGSQGMTVPLQLGTIDPHTQMPVTRANTPFCSEAVTMCMRWDPDTVIDIDDTAEPPTFNVRKLARWDYTTIPPTFKDYENLPLVTVDITASQERQIMLQGQNSKQWNGIIIYYKSLNQVGTGLYPHTEVDKYPPGITDKTPFVLSHTIELLGSNLQPITANVKTNTDAPFTLLGGVAASQKQWWVAHDKSLSEPNIDPASISIAGAVTITDDNGNAINGSFIYELLDSTIQPWVGSYVRATIRQAISYKRYKDAGRKVLDVTANERVHVKTIKLCNVAGGFYDTIGSIAEAEPVPQNVAESCFRTMAADQWAGEITLLDSQLRADIKVGTRLRLVGPSHTFGDAGSGNALLVQSVRQRPAFGETNVVYGPGPVVDIDTWIEFARASRSRITWELPSARGDGGASSSKSTSVDTSAIAPDNDTAHAPGGFSRNGASFKQS